MSTLQACLLFIPIFLVALGIYIYIEVKRDEKERELKRKDLLI